MLVLLKVKVISKKLARVHVVPYVQRRDINRRLPRELRLTNESSFR